MFEAEQSDRERLRALLLSFGRVKVAVSGGVDSLTLAVLAGRTLGAAAVMFHARSPAVPAAASRRVQQMAAGEGWDLRLVDAGEFADPAYLANPYRRCFHCKDHLYARLVPDGPGVTLSGTNADDLGDFRPGLQAAAQRGVRHPFAECGIDKAGVRRLCRALGYPDVAVLPASPCLSSRVETGLRIEPAALRFVDQVESLLRDGLAADRAGAGQVVRCRLRPGAIGIQLDPDSLERLDRAARGGWQRRIAALAAPLGLPTSVIFETYRMGSAFVARE